MLRINGVVKERSVSCLLLLVALVAGANAAGCIDESRDYPYCINLWFENHTPQIVDVSFWVTPESAPGRVGNDNPWRLEPEGEAGDAFGYRQGTYDQVYQLSVRHHEAGFVNRTLTAESMPANWTVIEYGSHGITFGARDGDWDRSPCNSYP